MPATTIHVGNDIVVLTIAGRFVVHRSASRAPDGPPPIYRPFDTEDEATTFAAEIVVKERA